MIYTKFVVSFTNTQSVQIRWHLRFFLLLVIYHNLYWPLNKDEINAVILKEILNDNLRTALMPFDRDGDGTIDAEELQQAAKDHQTMLMSRKILAWFSFAEELLFMVIVCGGLSVGIYYIGFVMILKEPIPV